MRALGLAIRIADNLAVVAYGYKDGLPRAYADNYVEFSATQRVGWVEPLRNPSCSSSGEWMYEFRLRSTIPRADRRAAPPARASGTIKFSPLTSTITFIQRVGWVEPLRNPSCFVIGGGFMGFACAPTYPTR